VVLAAGSASRFGGGKQLAPLRGRPLAAWAVQAALAAGLARVLVILGDRAEEIAATLPIDPRLTLVPNPEHARGMGTSLALAARLAQEGGAGTLVTLLADQPFVQPVTIAEAARAALDAPTGAAAAQAGKRRGHPVAFARRHFPELARLTGDEGGRSLLARLGESVALVPAPAESLLDVDESRHLLEAERLADSMLAWAAPGPLCRALGLLSPQVVALVGSGGKTSLMYALAHELAGAGRRVAITTTTHILPPQDGQAEGPWLWGEGLPAGEELGQRLVPGDPLVIAKSTTAAGKLKGLAPEQVALLAGVADLFTLVEADGAARKPLKGWAGHEPVIPAQARLVVVLAGATGLGRPLRADTVHRPEAFAQASGLALGDTVTPAALAQVLVGLTGQAGPLRGLPPGARAVMVLGQAEAAAPAEQAALFAALHRTGVFAGLLRGSLYGGRLEAWDAA
jgi:molybdenum cofactor cytidylyltransferase